MLCILKLLLLCKIEATLKIIMSSILNKLKCEVWIKYYKEILIYPVS